MFFLQRPSVSQIENVVNVQSELAFTYPAISSTENVGIENDGQLAASSMEELPPEYVIDHNRVKLGHGQVVFERAKEAIRQWQMFNLGWVQIFCPSSVNGFAPIEVGTTVGVLASRPFWSLNSCRIVYTVDEERDEERDTVLRFGFGYGTLPSHVEKGEERFQVEWHRSDDSVWYDIVAFSQPNHWLAKVGNPIVRQFQKRFARDSKAAMVRASVL